MDLQSQKDRINSRLNEIESNNGANFNKPTHPNARPNSVPTGPVGMMSSVSI